MTETEKAMERYRENYDNDLYQLATEGKPVEYCNMLIDAAMACCNHPYYLINAVITCWNETATDFLANFRSPQFNSISRFKLIEKEICPDCHDLLDEYYCADCHIIPALDPEYKVWLAKQPS